MLLLMARVFLNRNFFQVRNVAAKKGRAENYKANYGNGRRFEVDTVREFARTRK